MEDEEIANAAIIFWIVTVPPLLVCGQIYGSRLFKQVICGDIWQLLFERNTINMSDRTDGTKRENMIDISTWLSMTLVYGRMFGLCRQQRCSQSSWWSLWSKEDYGRCQELFFPQALARSPKIVPEATIERK